MSGKISEADKKAVAKYHKEKTKSYGVRFLRDADADIIEFLDSRSEKTEMMRQGLRLLMKAEKKRKKSV